MNYDYRFVAQWDHEAIRSAPQGTILGDIKPQRFLHLLSITGVVQVASRLCLCHVNPGDGVSISSNLRKHLSALATSVRNNGRFPTTACMLIFCHRGRPDPRAGGRLLLSGCPAQRGIIALRFSTAASQHDCICRTRRLRDLQHAAAYSQPPAASSELRSTGLLRSSLPAAADTDDTSA